MGGTAQQYANPIQSLPFGAPTQQGQIQQLLNGNIGALPPSGGNPMGPGAQGQPAPGGFQGPGVGGGGYTPGSPMGPGVDSIPTGGNPTGPGMRGTPAPGTGAGVSIPVTGYGHSTPAPQGPAGPMQSQYNPSPQFLQNLNQQMGQMQKDIGQGNFQPLMSNFGPGQSPMGRPSWQSGMTQNRQTGK